jgi:hypothetical protein
MVEQVPDWSISVEQKRVKERQQRAYFADMLGFFELRVPQACNKS